MQNNILELTFSNINSQGKRQILHNNKIKYNACVAKKITFKLNITKAQVFYKKLPNDLWCTLKQRGLL